MVAAENADQKDPGSNLLNILLFLLCFKSEECWFKSREQLIDKKNLPTQIRNIPTALPYQGSAELPHHGKKYSAQKRRLGFVTFSLISLCSLPSAHATEH